MTLIVGRGELLQFRKRRLACPFPDPLIADAVVVSEHDVVSGTAQISWQATTIMKSGMGTPECR